MYGFIGVIKTFFKEVLKVFKTPYFVCFILYLLTEFWNRYDFMESIIYVFSKIKKTK